MVTSAPAPNNQPSPRLALAEIAPGVVLPQKSTWAQAERETGELPRSATSKLMQPSRGEWVHTNAEATGPASFKQCKAAAALRNGLEVPLIDRCDLLNVRAYFLSVSVALLLAVFLQAPPPRNVIRRSNEPSGKSTDSSTDVPPGISTAHVLVSCSCLRAGRFAFETVVQPWVLAT